MLSQKQLDITHIVLPSGNNFCGLIMLFLDDTPETCIYSNWSPWSACSSSTCEKGKRMRQRMLKAQLDLSVPCPDTQDFQPCMGPGCSDEGKKEGMVDGSQACFISELNWIYGTNRNCFSCSRWLNMHDVWVDNLVPLQCVLWHGYAIQRKICEAVPWRWLYVQSAYWRNREMYCKWGMR